MSSTVISNVLLVEDDLVFQKSLANVFPLRTSLKIAAVPVIAPAAKSSPSQVNEIERDCQMEKAGPKGKAGRVRHRSLPRRNPPC